MFFVFLLFAGPRKMITCISEVGITLCLMFVGKPLLQLSTSIASTANSKSISLKSNEILKTIVIVINFHFSQTF